MTFVGNQFGLWSNNSGQAINIAPTNTDDVTDITIAANVLTTDRTPRHAIQLTNTDNVSLSGNVIDGFDELYNESGSTNIVEVGGGVTDHGALTGLTDDDHPQYLEAADLAASGAVGPILITDTPAGSPLIFGDLLQDEDGTDLLYADV